MAKQIIMVLVVVFAAAAGAAGGYVYRNAEVREMNTARVAVEKEVTNLKQVLAASEEDLEAMTSDRDYEADRADDLEGQMDECSEYGEKQTENVLLLLEALQASIDGDYLSAVFAMDDLEVPDDLAVCSSGPGFNS